MIIVNGTRWCSGALVNNACQDFTPNFLTAFHCLDSGDGVLSDAEKDAVQNWVFRFQYKSPTCGGWDDNSYVSFSGADFRAAWQDTDFALMELKKRPKSSTGIKYVGWNRLINTPSNSTSIHHPRGDVMKISIDNNPAVTNNQNLDWLGGTVSPPNTHWTVEIDEGTAEGGSSGGALFDQNRLLIGQLHGGFTGCAPVVKHYGRFDVSWTGGGTNDTRLSTWLTNNPSITQTNTLSIPKITGPTDACYYQTLNYTFDTSQLPPNTVIEGWDASPKFQVIVNSGSTLIVYGLEGAYYGDAWVQVRYRNQCSNALITERHNVTLHYGINSTEFKLTWSTSQNGSYQNLTSFWNSIPYGQYVYFKFNEKYITKNVVLTYGDGVISQGDENYDYYDYSLFMPTANNYNFLTFSATPFCGTGYLHKNASFYLSRNLYMLQTNPVSDANVTLILANDKKDETPNNPVIAEIMLKDFMGRELLRKRNPTESLSMDFPLDRRGIYYITLIGKTGWTETHKVIKK